MSIIGLSTRNGRIRASIEGTLWIFSKYPVGGNVNATLGGISKSCGEIEYGGCESGHLQSVASIELWIFSFLRFLDTDFSSTPKETLELN